MFVQIFIQLSAVVRELKNFATWDVVIDCRQVPAGVSATTQAHQARAFIGG